MKAALLEVGIISVTVCLPVTSVMDSVKNWIFSVLEKHRGLVVLLFCLPASFLFDLVLRIHCYIVRICDCRSHLDKVKEVQSAVRRWNDLPLSERKLLCTARPNWLSLSTTFFQKDQCHKIAIPLYNILSLDEANLSVKVEPLVKVGDITKYLLPKGYALAVHLEIAEATLGGLAMGVGMTTHSHKVGLFQETILSFDIVLSDGSLVHVTKDNQFSDLFKALPWSHGTLGFVVALELKIIPAEPFVHMHYIPVIGKKRYCSFLYELSGASDTKKNTPDFLEATIYSKHEAVILAGWFSDISDNVEVNQINRWYKPWFYKHVETFLKKGKSEELIPLEDYLLRHNRSIFWVLESMLPFGNLTIFRYLFGWLFPPKIAFLKYTTTPGK
ncbi:hypothetical protein J6590_004093 [Homalodisca vitripennis]|nr:hypothetical protein J6590_004088 [Homalodisca vitripennis]KAG8279285.1 hypothetical protein J6590_004093 [Homalodisca vitripennis]